MTILNVNDETAELLAEELKDLVSAAHPFEEVVHDLLKRGLRDRRLEDTGISMEPAELRERIRGHLNYHRSWGPDKDELTAANFMLAACRNVLYSSDIRAQEMTIVFETGPPYEDFYNLTPVALCDLIIRAAQGGRLEGTSLSDYVTIILDTWGHGRRAEAIRALGVNNLGLSTALLNMVEAQEALAKAGEALAGVLPDEE